MNILSKASWQQTLCSRLSAYHQLKVQASTLRMRLSSLFTCLVLPLLVSATVDEQTPLAQPDMPETYAPLTTAQPTLADLLTIEPSASIFYSYARELELSTLLSDPHSKSTLLVPTNKAVMALARKPHQGPAPDKEGIIISDEEFDLQSKQNVQRWVSAHIIPEAPISLTAGSYATLLDGKSVTVKEVEGKPDSPKWQQVVLNDGIHILSAKEAANGVLYMIDDTVKID
ncbi:hypothetical protein NM688_g7259 [Phlebia brevispora]|uniref:Uncharacterized protein n=1 Tax=Phlebia brevispora TaxID=194682 RepID=A0ACC1S7C1_9APHY|nr:hypothetical protein NM688_g7259 [Phlebia brevispora]